MTARGAWTAVLAVALGLGASAGVSAQVPPLATEVLAYEGLHRAAWHGDLPKLRSLIASGASLDARDPRGRTPLHVATHARQRDAVKLLAKAGANLDLLEDDRYDAVTIAAVADDVASLTLLLSLGANAGQTTSRYDGTALIAAAHLGHDEVVRRLIADGAPLDHVNNLHWTATIESIVLGDGGSRHQRTLAALIDAGASLKLADRQGNTPLQLARARGYTVMVKQLEAVHAK
ncbi:ankyrin repeat domain-containing protein [Variovorax sp. PAMC26660]|uniref:ankyrin repeat domain-containing protein n=1 Tax=Variovorax sp. PAMC26660 TaxID=2762322 RepID=UPI00164CE4A6|nr:ankyrin repeat domain-containing protein [Variovorax sp. PAMC26660]QNK67563.1 ankyrin repeat domain-containing protein [Variovorax sp. PAMC26660]